MDPVIMLITDGSAGHDADAVVARVGAAARAGVHLVQIRERTLDGGPLATLVTACVEAVRGTGTRVLVNERADVTAASAAHGVHLREDSMPPLRIRAMLPRPVLIGRSFHDPDAAAHLAADGASDYLLFGTVFATPSKAGRSPAGVDALRRAATGSRLPVLAVGGVELEHLGRLAAAGAAGFAAISFFTVTPPERLTDLVARARDAWRRG